MDEGGGDGDEGVDERYGQSVELSWEEIRVAMSKMGLVVEREERVETPYCGNIHSLMHSTYSCIFFSAVKRTGGEVEVDENEEDENEEDGDEEDDGRG